MKRAFVLFFIAFLPARILTAQGHETLRESITRLLAEQRLSGAVWATVSDSHGIVTDASGFRNVRTREALRPTDKVHVGSVSKTILAAGLLRLATLSTLDLDDPILTHLPDLPLENPWKDAHPVTIRHLLDHTSGLTDTRLWHVFSTSATPDTPLETVILNSPGSLRVQARPGAMYSYSNLGYTVLGMVIEKVSGQRYEDYLDDHVLAPLGMTNSTFHFTSQEGDHSDDRLAYGHFDGGEPVSAMPMHIRPAGQFTTTAGDMGMFLRFLMSDGMIDGQPFIRTDLLRSLGKPTTTDAAKHGVPVGDALGAYSRDRYGVVGLAKNGNILGFSAMIYLFLGERKAFFIAHNTDSESAAYDVFNQTLVEHLALPTRPFLMAGKPTEPDIARWDGYYVPVITKVEPFGLLDVVFSHTRVRTSGIGATLAPFQGNPRELTYQGDRLFSMSDRTRISHAFYEDEDGTLLITEGVRTMKKVSGLTILALACSLALGLSGLIHLFVAGCVQLVRTRRDLRTQPIVWVFSAILTLLLSIAFIANQSFMNLGDVTFGNGLLALGSALLPVFSVVTLVMIVKTTPRAVFTAAFWSTACVIQWCAVMVAGGLFPLILWR